MVYSGVCVVYTGVHVFVCVWCITVRMCVGGVYRYVCVSVYVCVVYTGVHVYVCDVYRCAYVCGVYSRPV